MRNGVVESTADTMAWQSLNILPICSLLTWMSPFRLISQFFHPSPTLTPPVITVGDYICAHPHFLHTAMFLTQRAAKPGRIPTKPLMIERFYVIGILET